MTQDDMRFIQSEEFRDRVKLLREVLTSPLLDAATARTSNRFRHRSGRLARRYVVHGQKLAKGVNETVAHIHATIKSAGKTGVTQVELQDQLSLPHSTVWYALKKLRKQKAVVFNPPVHAN